ncbi:hypothetical protein RhiirA1_452159 [Rhizophagus irregularis]|uniref:Uncharacterized protein n=1 Tax=Rhizophagus irregularis TaxID=588596 RepID=A0A2N0SAJ4_9GLOM|nr:hypothetical protein RhiirA1_452159 [Rhizophagus irregularis]
MIAKNYSNHLMNYKINLNKDNQINYGKEMVEQQRLKKHNVDMTTWQMDF